MFANARYLTFGLIVLGSYWLTVHNGWVFFSGDSAAAPPEARARASGGPRPSFWGIGYSGGK